MLYNENGEEETEYGDESDQREKQKNRRARTFPCEVRRPLYSLDASER